MKNIGIEKKAYLKFLETNLNAENVYLKALELGLTTQVFLNYVKNYIDKFDIKAKYNTVFNAFLENVSETNNVFLFLNSKIPINELEKDFAIYIMKYFYGKEDFEEITLKFKKCIRSLRRELGKNVTVECKNKSNSVNIDDARHIYASKIIEKFSKSKFSRERFILQNRLSYRDFEAFLAIVKKSNYEVNEAYKRKIEADKLTNNDNMTKDILNLLNLIKLKNGKLSLIEFFTNTNYGFEELKKHADKVLSPNDAKTFRINLTSLKSADVYDNSQITSLFAETFSINLYNIALTINEETKSVAIEFLIQNEIPVSTQTFREAVILSITNKLGNEDTINRNK